MLLPLLTFIAVLIGGISFASIIAAWNRDFRESAPPPVLLNRQVSLWSLVLFLFFPTVSAPSKPNQIANESTRHPLSQVERLRPFF
jgi:hypothetical protein